MRELLDEISLASDQARSARAAMAVADRRLKDLLQRAATADGANITHIARAAGITRQRVYAHLRGAGERGRVRAGV